MPINAHPDFLAAEKEYMLAEGLENKLKALKKMISRMPSHKGAENLRAQLKTRHKKLNSQLVKNKKSGKSKFKGIKKEDMQAAIIGKTNTGKSSLLSILSHAKPKTSPYEFSTTQSVIGMMGYEGTSIQLIEVPAFGSDYYDKSVVNTADTRILLVDKIEDILEIKKELPKSKAKIIVAFNKIDKLNENQKRKLSATLSSKKHNFTLISTKTKEGIEKLKEKIFQSFDNIRVFTKEPGKEKTKRPIILKPNSTIKHVAEKILHGFSKKVKFARVWGPSTKFGGIKYGLNHVLKDNDIVELHTS